MTFGARRLLAKVMLSLTKRDVAISSLSCGWPLSTRGTTLQKNAFLNSVSKKWFVLLFYNEEELSGLKLILSMSWHLHNLSPSSLKYLIEDYFHLFTIFANLLDELLWRQSGVFHKVGFHPFFAIGEWNNLIFKEVHFYKRDQFSRQMSFCLWDRSLGKRLPCIEFQQLVGKSVSSSLSSS